MVSEVMVFMNEIIAPDMDATLCEIALQVAATSRPQSTRVRLCKLCCNVSPCPQGPSPQPLEMCPMSLLHPHFPSSVAQATGQRVRLKFQWWIPRL